MTKHKTSALSLDKAEILLLLLRHSANIEFPVDETVSLMLHLPQKFQLLFICALRLLHHTVFEINFLFLFVTHQLYHNNFCEQHPSARQLQISSGTVIYLTECVIIES